MLYGPLLEQQTQHPSLSIHLEAAPNQSILNGISEGRIDIGIVTDAPNKSLFQSERIGREALCLILPTHKAEPLTPEILQNAVLLAIPMPSTI